MAATSASSEQSERPCSHHLWFRSLSLFCEVGGLPQAGQPASGEGSAASSLGPWAQGSPCGQGPKGARTADSSPCRLLPEASWGPGLGPWGPHSGSRSQRHAGSQKSAPPLYMDLPSQLPVHRRARMDEDFSPQVKKMALAIGTSLLDKDKDCCPQTPETRVQHTHAHTQRGPAVAEEAVDTGACL